MLLKIVPSLADLENQTFSFALNSRIASDKKMHEVVVMSDVISRLSTSSKVDSVIDLVSQKMD